MIHRHRPSRHWRHVRTKHGVKSILINPTIKRKELKWTPGKQPKKSKHDKPLQWKPAKKEKVSKPLMWKPAKKPKIVKLKHTKQYKRKRC